MWTGNETLSRLSTDFLWVCLIVMAVLLIFGAIRVVSGPRLADRILGINMMGTMVVVIIAMLAVLMGEGYLVDICIIYALLSFLAVIVLCKVFMGVYFKNRESGRETFEPGPDREDGE